MSVESAILISCSFAITALGLLILLRNPKGHSNQRFALLSISLVGWTVFNYLSDVISDINSGLLYTRLAFFFGAASVFWLIRFIAYFPNETIFRKNNLYRIHILCSAILLPIILTPAFISSIVSVPEPGIHTAPLYPLFILYVAYSMCLLPIIVLKQYKSTELAIEKQQLSLLTWGIAIYAILAATTSIVLPLVSNSWSTSKFGPLFTLVLVGVVAYSIVRHRLFDIRLVIARSIAYTLLLATLSGFYVAAFFSISKLFLSNDGFTTSQTITNVVLTIILAASLQPLKRFFEKVTDSIFYRDHYDPQTFLSDLSNVMAREIELVHLTDKVINILITQLRLSKALIVVMDADGIFYEANKESINYRSISLDELKEVGSGIAIKDMLPRSEVPKVFSKYGLHVSVGLHSTNELVGFLLLGEKRNGDIYNDSDIKILRILAQELAIAIHNARSYTQIQDFNKTLQVKIEEATEQLRSANENLKKMDGVKNEFLSMATHQLNTPLTVVDGYLTMINDGSHGKLTDEQRDFTQKALHRVRLMKRLVTDFLNVSRLETGKFSIESAPVDLNKVVSEEVNELGPTANEKEVLLQYMAPKHDVPVIEIDEQKTRQAIMNLIDNAIHYTPKGEVKVYLEADDKNVTFKVVDNGIGVPEKQKSKMFQKFSRGDNAKKERPSGSGVGLYLVKKVIEDQNGSIIFQSQEGKGSIFGFHLPIKTAASEQAEPELEPITPESKELEAIRTQQPKEKEGSYYKIIG
jgi:signal transduction histidine kinase